MGGFGGLVLQPHDFHLFPHLDYAAFDPSRGLAARIKKEAFAAGLICYPMSGTIDGQYGDHVLLAPPFVIEDAQIDELVGKLSTAIDKALAA